LNSATENLGKFKSKRGPQIGKRGRTARLPLYVGTFAQYVLEHQRMTYEPWARLREPEQQERDAKERRGDAEGFERYADDRCGEESGGERDHERSPCVSVSRAR